MAFAFPARFLLPLLTGDTRKIEEYLNFVQLNKAPSPIATRFLTLLRSTSSRSTSNRDSLQQNVKIARPSRRGARRLSLLLCEKTITLDKSTPQLRSLV